MEQYLGEGALAYIHSHEEELTQLLLALCAIPAPSHHEEKRAAFCKEWLEKAGGKNIRVDEALNVICPILDDGVRDDLVIFAAHMDTVFPDTEPMPLTMDEKRICCPGVGDDTANLAILMMTAKYILQNNLTPSCGMVIVCNSCEEGLGNLKGTRQLMKTYAGRVKAFISFDAYIGGYCCRALGSTRYRVTVKTEGGHSAANFGNRNAIHLLSSMICTFYTVKPPQNTTYNVGKIEGGTSVNTIAQQASMLYEFRCADMDAMGEMDNIFQQVVQSYQAMGAVVETELLGRRPCMGEIDLKKQEALERMVGARISAVTGAEAHGSTGSTDCNIPLSMGINAVCVGLIRGGHPHAREEYIERESLTPGFRLGMSILLGFFD